MFKRLGVVEAKRDSTFTFDFHPGESLSGWSEFGQTMCESGGMLPTVKPVALRLAAYGSESTATRALPQIVRGNPFD